MRQIVRLAAGLLLTGLAAAQVTIVGGGTSSLQDLANGTTLVTVLLKDREVQDANLRIVEVAPNFIGVVADNGERSAYLLDHIKEIRVQSTELAVRPFKLSEGRGLLNPEQKRIADDALRRAGELFEKSNNDQENKMDAAMFMAVGGKTEGRDYLVKLIQSEETPMEVRLAASLRLYITGETEGIDKVVQAGLETGNQSVRLRAAKLAGLIKYADPTAVAVLERLLADRAPELSAQAACALTRLGRRDIIPTLQDMLMGLNDERGEAAVFALSMLGGDEIIEQLKLKLENAKGIRRFRIARVLYNLGDPSGKEALLDIMVGEPTLTNNAAVILAKAGEIRARQVLLERLQRRFDPTRRVLLDRATETAAVIEGGDRTAVSALRDFLESGEPVVQRHVCRLIAGLGIRSLAPMMQSAMMSEDPKLALEACGAILALVDPGFRERLLNSWA